MQRILLVVGAFSALGFMALPAEAQQHPHVHAWVSETMFNNMWPEPFLAHDRQAVRAPFGIMIEKGWQLQNTLGDPHFDAETQELTRAGEMHLRWIVTQAPENRRTVLVYRGHNDTATSVRIDAVQQALARIQPRGALPPVLQTNVPAPASSAEKSDDLHQKAGKARPAPVLPAATSGSGGGSSTGT